MSVKLAEDLSPVTLSDQPSKTDCVVKSGEQIVLLGHTAFQMPDGTTRTDIADCKFESGSSLILYYGQEEEPITAPKKKEIILKKEPAILPEEPTISTLVGQTSNEIQSQLDKQTNESSGLLLVGAVATVVAASFMTSSRMARKRKSSLKKKNIDSKQQKRKEEQKKCNGKSQNIMLLMDEIEEKIDNNKISNDEQKYKEFFDSAHLVEEDLEKLNKKIDKLKSKIAKKTSK